MEYLDLNTDVIIQQAIERLNESTNFSFLSAGSKVRALIDIMGEEIGLTAEEFDANIGNAFLRGATGQLLDYIGEIYGMERLQPQKAEVFEEEENFLLYTLEPTFGDINNGDAIIIPKGSMRISNTSAVTDESVIYTNSNDVILNPYDSQQYFAAESLLPGEASNVGSSTLNFHDFLNYADSSRRSLLVTNEQAITYGRDPEIDDNYRYRIQQEKISSEAGNSTAIRLALLQIPGVADIRRLKYQRGIGTVDWLIQSTSPTVSDGLILECQRSIDENQSEGLSNIAKSPVNIGVEMFFSLTYKRALEDADKERIKSEVRSKIADLINNLAIGEDLIRDQVVRVVLNSSNEIESMGDVGSNENFSAIYLYKRSPVSNSVIRRTLTGDYRAQEDQRIILEPSVEAPIIIRDNN